MKKNTETKIVIKLHLQCIGKVEKNRFINK